MQATRRISAANGDLRRLGYGLLLLGALIPVAIFIVLGVDAGNFGLRGAGGPFVAFSAGVLSFVSPCVLPIVPVYITNLAGATIENGRVVADRRRTFSHAVAFIVGLTAVFVFLGTSAGLIGWRFNPSDLETWAGALLILLGAVLIPTYGRRSPLVAAIGLVVGTGIFVAVVDLAGLQGDRTRMALLGLAALAAWAKFAGYIQFSPFQRTFKLDIAANKNVSYTRSMLIGGAFATGWTPCVGPILGGILTLAATSGDAFTGAYLLLFYSAGFSIPFLFAGLLASDVIATTRKVQRFLPAFEIASAVMLIALGALLIAGSLTALNEYFDFAEFNQGL